MKLFVKLSILGLILQGSQVLSQTITTLGGINGPFCPGQVISVPYSITGIFNNNNVFRAQLSNSSGSFAAPTLIGSRTATTGGNITATIPANAAPGTGYRIRVVSTSPSRIGTDNGTNLVIYSTANCGITWTTSGNKVPSGAFIGTLNREPFQFKVNNVASGIIDDLYFNTALGYNSLITGGDSYNTVFGSYSLRNPTSFGNTAIGANVLEAITDGTENTGVGLSSLSLNTAGDNNTAVGVSSLLRNSTGDDNTAVGDHALYFNTTGFKNTSIGYYANVSTTGLFNSTAIGNSATVNSSNKVRIGNSSIVVVEGQVAYSFPSDARFKTNIRETGPGLDLIMKLRPVSYNFEYNKFSEFLHEHDRDEALLSQREKITQYGFIAQEVEKACKDLGLEACNLVHSPESEHDNYSMAYQNLVTPLVKAVQEQQILIEELKKSSNERIAALEAKIDAMVVAQGKTGSERAQSHEKAFLGQNIPNPFDHTTSIPFSIPTDCQNARIEITHASTGQSLKTVSLNCKDKQLLLEAGSLQPGNYTYSLIVNGRTVDTKQMVITR